MCFVFLALAFWWNCIISLFCSNCYAHTFFTGFSICTLSCVLWVNHWKNNNISRGHRNCSPLAAALPRFRCTRALELWYVRCLTRQADLFRTLSERLTLCGMLKQSNSIKPFLCCVWVKTVRALSTFLSSLSTFSASTFEENLGAAMYKIFTSGKAGIAAWCCRTFDWLSKTKRRRAQIFWYRHLCLRENKGN